MMIPDDDVGNWPDDRIWGELDARFAVDDDRTDDGWKLNREPIVQKGITPIRSFVAEPMRTGAYFLRAMPRTLFLPPAPRVSTSRWTGSLFSNLFAPGMEGAAVSLWMTSTLHRFPDENPFDRHRQIPELGYVTSSRAAAQSLAEDYVGLPLD